MAVDDAESYPVAAAALYDATIAALRQLGWTISSADPAALIVHASTSMSLATWGEQITVRVGTTGPATSTLHTTVALKFGLVDWGKRRRRIAEFKDAVRGALAMAPAGQPPAGWYPDPYGVASQRWWDGGAWTGHTS
jgi:hypothetical protein